jgi:PGF-CTERM protein
MRVYGTTAYSDVDLNVTVEQGVTAGGSGSFSETVDISAIPAGDYEIRATDGINTATTQVTIYAPGMLVAVAEPSHQTVNVSETANFDGSRSTGNVGIMSYKWDLGDGTNATGLTVSHTYSAAGPHTVTLTVYDAADSATDTCSVSVVSPPVEQNNTYSVNDTETTDGNNVTIHDTDISGDKPLNDTVLIVLDNGTLLVNIEVDEADNTTGVVTSVILDNTPVVDVSSNRTADIDLNLNSSVWAGGCPVLTTQIIYDLNDTVSGWNGTAVGTNATNEVTLAMSGLGLSDSGTAIMLHVNLSGINESDVLSLPISMTVDGDWYRDAADSTLTNVYLFKFYPNGTIKKQENPTGRHYDAANDTYTFYFVMPGFSTFALVGGKSKPSPKPSGGGGGDSTYPPGWFGTPAPAPTATPPPGATPAPAGGEVTPTPAKPKPAEAGKTPTAPAKETPTKKKGIPGFTAVFAIAGMLAIAYAVMRRRR